MDLITSVTKLVTTLNVFIPGTSSSVILMTVPNPYVSDAECGGLRGERSSCPAEPVCGLSNEHGGGGGLVSVLSLAVIWHRKLWACVKELHMCWDFVTEVDQNKMRLWLSVGGLLHTLMALLCPVWRPATISSNTENTHLPGSDTIEYTSLYCVRLFT